MRYLPHYISLLSRSPGRLAGVFSIAVLFVMVATLLPNRTFVAVIFVSESISFMEKVRILILSLGAFRTAFTVYNQIIMVVIGLLFGIQVVLTFQSVRQRFLLGKSAGMSTIAFVTGMFGVGCSACGSILFSSLFGVGLASFAVHQLPLHGYEFGLASIGILFFSILYMQREMKKQKACNLKK